MKVLILSIIQEIKNTKMHLFQMSRLLSNIRLGPFKDLPLIVEVV
jgi:hypothetical protein